MIVLQQSLCTLVTKAAKHKLALCVFAYNVCNRKTDRQQGRQGEGERGRQGVMYSYQSSQSSAAADKQKCEGQLRCRGLIDMAGAQRITHTHTVANSHTNTSAFCCLPSCICPQMHRLLNVSRTFTSTAHKTLSASMSNGQEIV